MKSFKSIGLAVLSLLSVGACRVDTPDGKVPPKYISEAQKYEGTYSGSFEGQNAHFTLQVADDGTATFLYRDADGDLIGPGCDSRIGALTALWATSKKVGGAGFALDTTCNILGKTVAVDFKKNGKVDLSVVRDSYTVHRRVCNGGGTVCNPSGNCWVSPPQCHDEETVVYRYLNGEFQKD